MPPIFGILNTKLQQPDREMIKRMNDAARYVKPRKVEAIEVTGGYLATAVVADNPLVPGKDVMAMRGEWVVVGDVSLYKKSERVGDGGDKETRRKEDQETRRRGDQETRRQGDKVRGGDVELVLEAWLMWGEECLRHLYGDFAFVIFNTHTGEVFCGRDPLGVRPLFYCTVNQAFIFGSELRYVVESLPIEPVIRYEYLLDTLITVITVKELTPYENIFRLKPGHFLQCSIGEVYTSQYWSLDPEKTIRFEKEEDYIRLFRENLVIAFNSRCEGVKTLGSELSGGLDSSAVCGIAADFTKQGSIPFTTFSNIFPAGTEIEFKDEREFIGAMRDFKPMNWNGVDRLNLTIPELLNYTIDIQGGFIQQNYNIFNRSIYETAGKKGIEVLLSGFGGDEMVSARTAIPWNELIHDRQWQVILDELYYKGVTIKGLLKPGKIALRYLGSLLYKPKYRSGVFTPDLLNKRFANLPLQQEFAIKNQLRKRLGDKFRQLRRDRLAMRQHDRIMLDHLPQRMEYCYAAAAQYGIEYRYPLLDVDLVETCLAFPPWVKQHHGVNRYIFRQAIKGFVPEKIRERDDKSGTTIPQMYYSLCTEREVIMDLVNSCSGSEFLKEIFDFSNFPQWYERLVKRAPEDMNYLMPGAFYDYLMIMMYYRDKEE
jgi:asparagine synthase (glutamine-hydrolysing)